MDEQAEDRRLMRAYGITLAQRDQLLREQDYRCAICEVPETPETHRLCVDRDPIDGVRGLLCYTCNRAFGTFGSVEVVERALVYLVAARARGAVARRKAQRHPPPLLARGRA